MYIISAPRSLPSCVIILLRTCSRILGDATACSNLIARQNFVEPPLGHCVRHLEQPPEQPPVRRGVGAPGGKQVGKLVSRYMGTYM